VKAFRPVNSNTFWCLHCYSQRVTGYGEGDSHFGNQMVYKRLPGLAYHELTRERIGFPCAKMPHWNL